MNRLLILLLCVSGCSALNIPRNRPTYADEGWVYPDPTRFREPEQQPDWIDDGKEEWRGLKMFLKSIRGTP